MTLPNMNFHFAVHKWLFIHLFGQIFVILWVASLFHQILAILIPIAGRSGGQSNVDIMIGVVCSVMTLLMCSYFVSELIFPLCKSLYRFSFFRFP